MLPSKEKSKSLLIILIPMIFIALILHIVHLPAIISENRPNLLVLVLIFFSLSDKFNAKIEAAWICGLILDLLTGSPLGLNAFVITTQVYLLNNNLFDFKNYSLWQQTLVIGIINLLISFIAYWIQHLLGQSFYDMNFLIPAAATAAFWPVIYTICFILCGIFSVEIEKKKETL